jgi:hypothetical protein
LPSIPAAILPALTALQVAGATIHGTVTDAGTGDPVASALVSLPELHASVLTDAAGRYRVPDVPAGPQHVDVSHLGYDGRGLHVFVPADGSIELHVALDRRPFALEELVVTSAAGPPVPIPGEASPTIDLRVSGGWLRRDPRSPEPDAFVSLTGGGISTRPEAADGLHVRGAGADHVAFLLDGLPVLSPYHAAGSFSAWDPDAVRSIEVATAYPRAGSAAALAGQVHAETILPGNRVNVRGALSATQARVSLDAPLPWHAGVLLSAREPFAGLSRGSDEPALLRGDASDRLAVLHVPLLGGRLRALAYGNENELNASALADGDAGHENTPVDAPRNRFAWSGATFGATWVRDLPGGRALEVAVWDADADARVTWSRPPPADGSPAAVERLRSDRRDVGATVALRWGGEGRSWAAGIRWNRSATRYEAASEDAQATLRVRAETPALTAFATHSRPIAGGVHVDAGLRAIASGDDPYVAPQAQLRWSAGEHVELRVSYARTVQFEQSLANPESAAGLVFPAQAFAGAEDDVLPVARGHQVAASAVFSPRAGLTLRASGWLREAHGLLFAAPESDGPFALDRVGAGSGSADGVAAEASWAGSRFTVVGAYAVQRVRNRHANGSFVPDYAATHRADLGANVYVTPTFAGQVAAQVVGGRRTTAMRGAFEWESCNLLELGCEFAGSPVTRAESLGAWRLPAYARLDVGLRKHWDLDVGGRRGVIGVFVYATNLLGRSNVLLITEDPETGSRQAVEMRPRAPLSAGLDWRF